MAFYRSGMFEFDSASGDIRKGGRSVRLRPQPARILEYLLEHRGRLVSREELKRATWPDGRFVQFDAGLNSCMKQIRAALDELGAGRGAIETLVRRGFRFTGSMISADKVQGATTFTAETAEQR
jgi:DNA-binding winged helix-turn-helix (wHTH) protein